MAKPGLSRWVMGKIVLDEFAQKNYALCGDAFMQEEAILGVKLRIRRGFIESAQFEPLTGRTVDEALAAFVGEQTIHFTMQHFGLVEVGGEQLSVRWAVPEPI